MCLPVYRMAHSRQGSVCFMHSVSVSWIGLQDMEEAAQKLRGCISTGRKDKAQLLADIVQTEKQVRFHKPAPHGDLSWTALSNHAV